MDSQSARQQFQNWLDYLPEYLNEVRHIFSEEDRQKLDFSPESLDVIEAFILSTYPHSDSMLPSAEAATVNLLTCYIGEVFRRSLAIEWELQLNSGYVYFGLPVLVLKNGDVRCPLSLATTAAARRTGRHLRKVFDNSTGE